MKKYLAKLTGMHSAIRRILIHPAFVWLSILAILFIMHFKFNIGVQAPLFVITALSAGWIVAFHTTHWSQKKNFINNLKFKAANILIDIATNTSHALVNLNGDAGSLKTKIDLRKGPTGDYFTEWGDLLPDIDKHYKEYSNYHILLLGAYENNEILLLDFKKLIQVFNIQHSKTYKAYYDLRSTLHVLMLAHKKIPKEDKYTEKVLREAHELGKICMDTMCYLHDLRIDLLNKTLGPIVHEKVPNRKPQDPSILILSEVAKNENSAI